MMLVARARQNRIAGIIGIATAPDFTDDLIWNELNKAQQQMARDGHIALPNPYAPEDVIYPYHLIVDGRNTSSYAAANPPLPRALTVWHG